MKILSSLVSLVTSVLPLFIKLSFQFLYSAIMLLVSLLNVIIVLPMSIINVGLITSVLFTQVLSNLFEVALLASLHLVYSSLVLFGKLVKLAAVFITTLT